MNLLELLTGGFYTALNEFKTQFLLQQEQRDVVFSDKLNQVLQNQQASEAAIAAINEAISSETTQITESLKTLTDTNATQAQTIVEQGEQIKQLLAQVDQGNTTLTEAQTVIDSIIQKQQEQLTAQQGLVTKISDIFTPPTSTPTV